MRRDPVDSCCPFLAQAGGSLLELLVSLAIGILLTGMGLKAGLAIVRLLMEGHL